MQASSRRVFTYKTAPPSRIQHEGLFKRWGLRNEWSAAISKAQFTGKANSAILRFSDRNFSGLPCWFVSAVNAAKQGESHVAALKRMLRTVGRKCLLVRMEGCRGVGSVKNAGSSCTKQDLRKEETLIYFTLFYHGVALPSFAQPALCPSWGPTQSEDFRWQQRQALNGALEVAASLCLT